MVVILRKKKALNRASANLSPSLDGSVDKQHRNQLLEPVSPFEECHEYSSRYTQSSVFVNRVLRRKHSTQSRQLVQLKAHEVLRPAAKIDSDTTAPPLESLVARVLAAPARTKPDTSDLFNPIDLRGCYDSHYPGACSCVVPPGAHQVPCIISITNLDDYDDDASSELSLEDAFLHMSTSTNTTGQTSTEQLMGTHATHPAAFPKSCLLMATGVDSESTGSSILWPSDEDDSETGCNETCFTNDGEEHQEDSQLFMGRSSSLQLITEIRNLTCSDEASLQMLGAGCGFKVWSEVYPEPAIGHRNDAVDISAARDEHEEKRRDEVDENEDREDSADTRCSF